MFGTSATTTELAADQLESLNTATEAIGLPKPRWRKDSAEFLIKGTKYPVPISSLRTFMQRADVRSSPTVAALALAELLTITAPHELLRDLRPIQHLLRPRLLHPRELQGPRRAMCRRDVLDHLIQAIAVGRSELAPLVTSATLDRWGLTFEELLSVALENLREVLTADHLHDVEGAPGVLALLHRHEQASAGAFILEGLFLDSTAPHGVVFSTPREDLLLALPVVANAGPDGLAAGGYSLRILHYGSSMDPVQANIPIDSPMGHTHEGFVSHAVARGERASRASEDYSRFFREGVARFPHWLAEAGEPANTLTSESAEGDVIKFLLTVPGRNSESLETESVIIPMQRRHTTTKTLCVSSQVGCAMGCVFCETAQMGLIRSLKASEIVRQWFVAQRILGHDIKNIVFMGMGEPLDNVPEVLQAIRVLTDRRGPAIAMSGITVSTVGRLDGLAMLREAVQEPGWKQLNLAVSINAPNDAVRSAIMPINRSMPLDELIAVMETWPRRKSGAICVEYVLIPGVNDREEHAAELCEKLKRVRCCVNVIPYNPRRASPWEAPTEESVSAFLAALESRGQFCKRRRTKGRESMAACGQLGNEAIRKRKFVGVTLDQRAEAL